MKKAKTKRNAGIRWTVDRASQEWGVSSMSLARWLRQAEHKPDKSGTFSTRQIDTAIHSDIKAERLRKIQLENELLTLERSEKSKELVSMEEATAILSNALAPVRQKLLALPAEMASRCNPSDPDLALAALAQWRDGALRFCRGEKE